MSEDRAAALAAIAEEIRGCAACPLHAGRTRTVPGAGDILAEIMFIGEGPGENEDKQGLPFVGRSGDYLNYLLNLIGLKREQVFITNVVKCRPPGNRDPEALEVSTCTSAYLERQVKLIDPLVIATLGRFSMGLYFPNGKISSIHGQPKYDDRRAYYPIFHPAAALRNPGLRRDMEADFHRLLEVVEKVRMMRGGSTPPKRDDPPPADEPPRQLSLF